MREERSKRAAELLDAPAGAGRMGSGDPRPTDDRADDRRDEGRRGRSAGCLKVVVTRQRRAAELLDKAADLLERDGWTQGGPRDGRGARCVNAALSEAGGSLFEPAMPDAVEALLAELVLLGWDLDYDYYSAPTSACQLQRLNDARDMTAERMIGAMRTAAAGLRDA